MAPRKKPPTSSATDAKLDSLLSDVNPQRATQERKFQVILDHYNNRNENREEGLSGVKFYVYRTFPRVDNRLSGRQHSNIETYECVRQAGGTADMLEIAELPADIRSYVQQRHGGGRFRVSLNDKGRELEQVAQTALKIDDIEFPPILDPKELVTSDPETLQWITRQVALGSLVKNADGSFSMPNDRTSPRAAAASGSEDTGLAAVAMEALRQSKRGDDVDQHAYKAAIDMVRENAPKPTDPLATITAMAAVMKSGGGDSGLTAMCGLMSTMMVEQNKMMMFMMAQKNPAPREGRGEDDSVDRVERVLEMVGKYGGPKPSGGGGWLDTLKELAPMLLPLFLMGKVPPQQLAAMTAARPGAEAIPDAAAPESGIPGGGPLTAAQAEDFAGRAALAMQRGHDGGDFGLAVEVIFGTDTYEKIRQLGQDNIIGFLLQSRGAQFFGSQGPATTQFISEFLSYGEAEAPPAGTPPAPPVATAAAPVTA